MSLGPWVMDYTGHLSPKCALFASSSVKPFSKAAFPVSHSHQQHGTAPGAWTPPRHLLSFYHPTGSGLVPHGGSSLHFPDGWWCWCGEACSPLGQLLLLNYLLEPLPPFILGGVSFSHWLVGVIHIFCILSMCGYIANIFSVLFHSLNCFFFINSGSF